MNGTDNGETGVVLSGGLPESRRQSLTEQIQDVLDASMRMAELQRRIVETAVRITNHQDWTNLGGKPYLCEAGAMKAASVLPVEIYCIEKPTKTWADDENGRYYIYACEYGAKWKGGLGAVTATGTASSRDKFFSMKNGERLPLSEIDETNLIKKCATNGRHNAIVRLLGLQNLTMEEVKSFGIDTAQLKGTAYDGKKEQKQDENPEQANSGRDEIWKLLMEMNNGDAKAAGDDLEKLTAWEKDGQAHKGKRDVKWLTEKQVDWKLSEVKKRHAAWKAKQPAQQPTT